MKKNLLTTILSFALLLFIACDNDDDAPIKIPNQPGATKQLYMKAKVDSVNWEADYYAVNRSGSSCSISGYGTNGENIIFYVYNVNKVGRYRAGGISIEKKLFGSYSHQWVASLNDSTNVFNVIKYDSVNKKMSGNFSFKTTYYQGSDPASSPKTVTDGTFTDLGIAK